MNDYLLTQTAIWLLFYSKLVQNPAEQLQNIGKWTELNSVPDIESELRKRTQELEIILDSILLSEYEKAEDPTEFNLMFNAIKMITQDLSEFIESLADQPIGRNYLVYAILAVMYGIRKQVLLANFVLSDRNEINGLKESADKQLTQWAKQFDQFIA